MRIVNLCKHNVDVVSPSGAVKTVPPSGVEARVATTRVFDEPVVLDDGFVVQISKPHYGEVEGLPAPQEGVMFVVSGQTLAALNGSRPDVFSPGNLLRGPDGQPKGCEGLSKG